MLQGLTVKNEPNGTNTLVAGCSCSICTTSPFEADIDTFSKETLNAIFQALMGEATAPSVAARDNLEDKHAEEAFAIISVILNRAAYDKALIARGKPAKWGYNSDGTALGVLKTGAIVAYTKGTHETYFKQAKKDSELQKGKPSCKWLETLKKQIEILAKDPSKRNDYNEWRTYNATKTGRDRIMNNHFWKKELAYEDWVEED